MADRSANPSMVTSCQVDRVVARNAVHLARFLQTENFPASS